jgi:hypothetical protein
MLGCGSTTPMRPLSSSAGPTAARSPANVVFSRSKVGAMLTVFFNGAEHLAAALAVSKKMVENAGVDLSDSLRLDRVAGVDSGERG